MNLERTVSSYLGGKLHVVIEGVFRGTHVACLSAFPSTVARERPFIVSAVDDFADHQPAKTAVPDAVFVICGMDRGRLKKKGSRRKTIYTPRGVRE